MIFLIESLDVGLSVCHTTHILSTVCSPSMNLNLTTATRYGLNVLALLGASVALHLGQSIFVPLTIAALLAAIMWPWANSLNRKFKLPWFFACTTVIGLLVVGIALVFFLIGSAIPQMLNDLPSDEARQQKLYENIRKQLIQISPSDVGDSLPPELKDNSVYKQLIETTFKGENVFNAVRDITKFGGTIFWQSVLILFILLFLLLEGEMLVNKVRNIFGPGLGVQSQVTAAIREMAEAVRSYLIWRTLVNFGLAVVLGVVYKSLGLNQWVLWSVLTFIFCYVPYLGTIAAGVPPILEALIHPGLGAGYALGIAIFYSAVVTFEGYIIVPWVMGRSMDLNATTVLISCLYWDLVWGTAGLFLAMPLMAAIKAVCLRPSDEFGRHTTGTAYARSACRCNAGTYH
jgi:AI-2 transport protein TqsA